MNGVYPLQASSAVEDRVSKSHPSSCCGGSVAVVDRDIETRLKQEVRNGRTDIADAPHNNNFRYVALSYN